MANKTALCDIAANGPFYRPNAGRYRLACRALERAQRELLEVFRGQQPVALSRGRPLDVAKYERLAGWAYEFHVDPKTLYSQIAQRDLGDAAPSLRTVFYRKGSPLEGPSTKEDRRTTARST